MRNRQNLHDAGIALILFGIVHLVLFAATVIADLVDGSFAAAMAEVKPEYLVATKVTIGILGGLMGLLVLTDAFIGIKALKVSKKPDTSKGYITVAKVFFVISVIAAVVYVGTLIGGRAPIVDTILNLASTVLDAVVYFLFAKAALAVRNDVINGVK